MHTFREKVFTVAAGPYASMSSSEDTWSVEEEELWGVVREQILEAVGEDADVRVHPAGGHLDVRIIPRDLKDSIEGEHDDLEVVPYNALRLTIQRDR